MIHKSETRRAGGRERASEGVGLAVDTSEFSTPSICLRASPRFEAALAYGKLGRAVFPCQARQKEPATKRGFYDATLNPATVTRWWKAQDYNIGIRTGAESGVWVFDVDGDDGRDSLAKLVTTHGHGALPVTPVSITQRGVHFWFRYTGPIPS